MAGRRLSESFQQTAPLRVDREKGIIFGVRVLGPVSRNRYGVNGVDGTEYSPGAHADARRMYEGMTVRLNHVRDQGTERKVQEAFGVLRNATTALDNGQPVTSADLHFLSTHEMGPRVCEDVEKKLGVFGLSHEAYSGKERVDKGRKKLVIESLTKVVSVDLVDGAATNRNLWESQDAPAKTTLKATLETLTELPPGKAAWRRRLLEDAEMAMNVGAEYDQVDDPDAAMAAGFRTAILAVLDDEGLSVEAKKTKIGMLLTVQDKLKSGVDPAAPTETDMATETPKTESVDPAEFARIKAENDTLKADKELTGTVRKLCESVKFTPTDIQLTAIKSLPDDASRKTLIESFRPSMEPRSGYTGKRLQEAGNETETKPAADKKSFLQAIRR